MDLKRVCVHEAGHFYVAYRFNPARAISINISREMQSGYVSPGHTDTLDLPDSEASVLVAIRAAGLAAESLIYNELICDLMQDPMTLKRIENDTDNAKDDLKRSGLRSCSDNEFNRYWEMGLSNAKTMLCGSLDKLCAIANYCLAHTDREIPASELVEECNL